MDYQESLEYIKQCTKHGIKLGLDRVQEILKRLGNPQEKFRAIHIAGTNGKGSTAAMFDAVLREAGYQTGRYTSPHLVCYRERFTVNNEPITQIELAAIITTIKPVIESVRADGFGEPTEFEVGTAIAFEFFAQRKIAVGIIEVGMGGRFDATNVISPILSVITHIALDHQEYLGETTEKIAFEKAGIIKPTIPVIIGVQDLSIARYLTQITEERGAPFKLAGDILYQDLKLTEDGAKFMVEDSYLGKFPVKLGLTGEHQVANSLNVLAGLEFLERVKIHISKEALLKGLSQTIWPGRLEKVITASSRQFYLDGAHNPDGVRALVKTVQAIFPGQKVDLLFGILNNRPYDEIAGILAEIARQVIVTTVPDPKSALVSDLAKSFRAYGIPTIIEPSPDAALKLILATDNQVALATGSLYLIGYLRSVLYEIGD